MNKYLVFDMDGTIADFYGVEGWLNDLDNENPRPYEVAEPLCDMGELAYLLYMLKGFGWTVAITSWMSKTATKDFCKAIRKAKKDWLAKYNFPADEIHIVKYGRNKAYVKYKNRPNEAILFDDEERNCNDWMKCRGNAIRITENTDICVEIRKILNREMNKVGG